MLLPSSVDLIKVRLKFAQVLPFQATSFIYLFWNSKCKVMQIAHTLQYLCLIVPFFLRHFYVNLQLCLQRLDQLIKLLQKILAPRVHRDDYFIKRKIDLIGLLLFVFVQGFDAGIYLS